MFMKPIFDDQMNNTFYKNLALSLTAFIYKVLTYKERTKEKRTFLLENSQMED